MRYNDHSFGGARRHQAEHGNTVTDLVKFTIPTQAVAGDTYSLPEAVWDTIYMGAKLIGVSGANTATGLTVSIGYDNMEAETEAAMHNDAAFSAAASAAIPMATAPELMAEPFEMRERRGLGVRHRVTMTLGGTVTPGKEFWLRMERLFIGSN